MTGASGAAAAAECVGLSDPLEQCDPVLFNILKLEETLEPPMGADLDPATELLLPPLAVLLLALLRVWSRSSSSVSSCTVEVGGEIEGWNDG